MVPAAQLPLQFSPAMASRGSAASRVHQQLLLNHMSTWLGLGDGRKPPLRRLKPG